MDCLELVSSQLSCKPYMVSIQRVRLLYCLEACGFYKEAENEGFGVLEKLRGLDLGEKKKRKEKLGEFVPNVVENGDAEFAKLVVEVVVAIVKCVALRQGTAGGDYKKVIRLVDEVAPWFRCVKCYLSSCGRGCALSEKKGQMGISELHYFGKFKRK